MGRRKQECTVIKHLYYLGSSLALSESELILVVNVHGKLKATTKIF